MKTPAFCPWLQREGALLLKHHDRVRTSTRSFSWSYRRNLGPVQLLREKGARSCELLRIKPSKSLAQPSREANPSFEWSTTRRLGFQSGEIGLEVSRASRIAGRKLTLSPKRPIKFQSREQKRSHIPEGARLPNASRRCPRQRN